MVNFVLNNKYLNSIYSMVIRKAIILRIVYINIKLNLTNQQINN